MILSRKAALGVAVCAGALLASTAGTAEAAYGGDLYGSIAVADRGDSWHYAVVWNHPDQGAADADALQTCGFANCIVQVRFMNGCGAVADRDGRLYAGVGRSLVAAENAARAASGPDPNPLLVGLGSAEPSSVDIVASGCTD
ncbi:DUF4189 domain-containing protein [Nocardia yunnanensis]|uniref:DUF4189 domain-containing protein n=1 Tax=Nocardia yunnanensis TaxID=2382165 RepID=A0A386ZIS9_9NOCA|nr:DUF4189 domain-containing protein [Nocardia yunnanensis]AYF77447.1 DUF4189 domain-containing protein [Nocardia yunnanensis]